MKKTRKSILLLFLAVCIAISCAFAVAVFAQGGTASEGMTFSADKYFDMQSKVSPEGSITFEAELWVDPTKSEQSMIISNFYSGKSGDGRRTLLLNMQTDGRVRLHTQHASSVTFSTDIRQFCGTVDAPEFVKIAVTADTTNGVTILYVNGVEKERITKDTWNNKGAVFGNTDKVLRIGGDYQSGNTKYFKGILKNIAMYSDVRTAEEISASYSSSTGAYSVDKTDKNLLFAYDLSDSTVTERLVDLSANGNNAINPNVEQSFHGLKIERQEDSVSTNYPSASYEIGKKFDAIPETVEAWVYIPASVGTGRVGIIMGNYTGYALDAHLNFEVHENGVPRIQWYDESGKGHPPLPVWHS